jgi:hypothetical protein
VAHEPGLDGDSQTAGNQNRPNFHPVSLASLTPCMSTPESSSPKPSSDEAPMGSYPAEEAEGLPLSRSRNRFAREG